MAAMTSGQRTMITIHFCVQWESQKSASMLFKNKRRLSVLQLELATQQADAFIIYQVEIWPISRLPNTRISNTNLSIKLSMVNTKFAISGIIFTLWFFL
jgi:hypothetical protein